MPFKFVLDILLGVLKDLEGRKRKIVPLDEQIWRVFMQEILDEVRKKIAVLKNMIHLKLDEYICAGLYTFVLEEFGKLILLAQSHRVSNNKREVKYANEFTNHEKKFAAALDYLQAEGFEEGTVSHLEKKVTWVHHYKK